MGVVTVVAFFLPALFVTPAVLAAENLALRQQLAILHRSASASSSLSSWPSAAYGIRRQRQGHRHRHGGGILVGSVGNRGGSTALRQRRDI